jgi:hypothetical protein
MRVGYVTMPLHPSGEDPGHTMAGDRVDEMLPRL